MVHQVITAHPIGNRGSIFFHYVDIFFVDEARTVHPTPLLYRKIRSWMYKSTLTQDYDMENS